MPRPAMFVATVTAPGRPACATITASRSCCLAFSTWQVIPRRFSMSLSSSDFSMDTVPTSTGRPCLDRSTRSAANGVELGLFGCVYEIGGVVADHGPVSGDDHHLQLVESWHSSSASVDAVPVMPDSFPYIRKVVLERYGGVGDALALHLDALLGLYGLVQAVGVPASRHETPREVVDDDNLAVPDHVLLVTARTAPVRPQRVLDVVGLSRPSVHRSRTDW